MLSNLEQVLANADWPLLEIEVGKSEVVKLVSAWADAGLMLVRRLLASSEGRAILPELLGGLELADWFDEDWARAFAVL